MVRSLPLESFCCCFFFNCLLHSASLTFCGEGELNARKLEMNKRGQRRTQVCNNLEKLRMKRKCIHLKSDAFSGLQVVPGSGGGGSCLFYV